MMMQTTLTWENIPEPLLTRILSFLSIGDVARVSLVCNSGMAYLKTTVYGVVCFDENSSPRS